MKKTCKRCKESRPLTRFYKHKHMADGHLNFCKDCTKDRVSNHRSDNIEKIRAYDRERGKLPHRVAETIKRTRERRQALRGLGYGAAHNKVSKALISGELQKVTTCSYCNDGGRIEAHHEDYDKPLDVTWLCKPCHSMLHTGKTAEAKSIQSQIGVPF